MARYTFRKPEHLCLRNEIDALFHAGNKSFTVYPLRVTYRPVAWDGSGPRVKVLLSVSKRKFKHAVDRNRAKRQLREAYRLQKACLWEELPEGLGLHIAFIWLSDQPVPSAKIKKCMHTVLARMGEAMKKDPVPSALVVSRTM